MEFKKCGYCPIMVRTGYPTQVWTELNGNIYHNECLETVLKKAREYDKIEGLVRGSKIYGPSSIVCCSGAITDTWLCSLCGGYSGGYGVSTCRHCGAKAHYGSNNGHYLPHEDVK